MDYMSQTVGPAMIDQYFPFLAYLPIDTPVSHLFLLAMKVTLKFIRHSGNKKDLYENSQHQSTSSSQAGPWEQIISSPTIGKSYTMIDLLA